MGGSKFSARGTKNYTVARHDGGEGGGNRSSFFVACGLWANRQTIASFHGKNSVPWRFFADIPVAAILASSGEMRK